MKDNNASARLILSLLTFMIVFATLALMRDGAGMEEPHQVSDAAARSDSLWKQLDEMCPAADLSSAPAPGPAMAAALAATPPDMTVGIDYPSGLDLVSEDQILSIPQKSFMQGFVIPLPPELTGSIRQEVVAVLAAGPWKDADAYVTVSATLGDRSLLCYGLLHSARAIAVGSADRDEIAAQVASEPVPFEEWFPPVQPQVGTPIAVEYEVGESVAVLQPVQSATPSGDTFNMLAWMPRDDVLLHLLGHNVDDEELMEIANRLALK